MKSKLSIDLIIDGSYQDNLILSKRELQLISEALGQAVPNYDGEDKKPFLKVMRKVDKLLERWTSELKELRRASK